ncbi:MAG TPA: hypothetical protein VGC06_23020 [Actinomycetes bacterium]
MTSDRTIDELAERAYELASDTWRSRSGPLYYDNLLGALKETAVADAGHRKAAELARFAGNSSSTLQRAKQRVRELYGGEKHLEAAIDLLTEAQVLTASAPGPDRT